MLTRKDGGEGKNEQVRKRLRGECAHATEAKVAKHSAIKKICATKGEETLIPRERFMGRNLWRGARK